MSRQANGNYIQPANTAAISGQAISATAFNTLVADIGTEITNSVDRQGRSAMQANLPMGGNKITGAADPTNATDAATKNYVDTLTGTFFGTGDIKLTLKTVADAGWLLFDDGTFGNAGSGSSNSSAAANLALFTLFFNNLSDAAAPLLTSGGGATTRAAQTNAATAWAALCRMSLPKTLGRAFAAAGSGSGLSARALGAAVGEENHTLVSAELPASIPFTDPGHIHPLTIPTGVSSTPGNLHLAATANTTGLTMSTNNATTGITINPAGGSGHNNMQPTVFLNVMVKL